MNQHEITYNPAINRIILRLPSRPSPELRVGLMEDGYRAVRVDDEWTWQAAPSHYAIVNGLQMAPDDITDDVLDARVPIVDELPDYAAKAARRAKLAAKRDADAADALRAAAAAVEGIEPGQPVLVGHSAPRHRRALRRSDAAEGRAREAASKADYHRQRAASAERQAEKHSDPHYIAARLDAAETELRRYKGPSSALRWFMRQRVEYWTERASHHPVPQLDLQVGDIVKRRNGSWWVIEKINRKTYGLISGPCSIRVPHADIVGRVIDEEMASRVANSSRGLNHVERGLSPGDEVRRPGGES